MIYTAVPISWSALYERLLAYYADEPQVAPIVDRRSGERRVRRRRAADGKNRRVAPDRRRRRVTGDGPTLLPGRSTS